MKENTVGEYNAEGYNAEEYDKEEYSAEELREKAIEFDYILLFSGYDNVFEQEILIPLTDDWENEMARKHWIKSTKKKFRKQMNYNISFFHTYLDKQSKIKFFSIYKRGLSNYREKNLYRYPIESFISLAIDNQSNDDDDDDNQSNNDDDNNNNNDDDNL